MHHLQRKVNVTLIAFVLSVLTLSQQTITAMRRPSNSSPMTKTRAFFTLAPLPLTYIASFHPNPHTKGAALVRTLEYIVHILNQIISIYEHNDSFSAYCTIPLDFVNLGTELANFLKAQPTQKDVQHVIHSKQTLTSLEKIKVVVKIVLPLVETYAAYNIASNNGNSTENAQTRIKLHMVHSVSRTLLAFLESEKGSIQSKVAAGSLLASFISVYRDIQALNQLKPKADEDKDRKIEVKEDTKEEIKYLSELDHKHSKEDVAAPGDIKVPATNLSSASFTEDELEVLIKSTSFTEDELDFLIKASKTPEGDPVAPVEKPIVPIIAPEVKSEAPEDIKDPAADLSDNKDSAPLIVNKIDTLIKASETPVEEPVAPIIAQEDIKVPAADLSDDKGSAPFTEDKLNAIVKELTEADEKTVAVEPAAPEVELSDGEDMDLSEPSEEEAQASPLHQNQEQEEVNDNDGENMDLSEPSDEETQASFRQQVAQSVKNLMGQLNAKNNKK